MTTHPAEFSNAAYASLAIVLFQSSKDTQYFKSQVQV